MSRQASRFGAEALKPSRVLVLGGGAMYLCYIDESGTSQIPGTTTHFILAGLSIPIWHWRSCDNDITKIKNKYCIGDAEIHTAWLARKYIEQKKINNFDSLDYRQRRTEIERYRNAELLRLQRVGKSKHRQAKKNYKHTADYAHLTYAERRQLLLDLAGCIANWGFARLFSECVNKLFFDPTRTAQTIDEQAFEQVVSRFEQFLEEDAEKHGRQSYGLLIHDNNETVSQKHTRLMSDFHKKGTLWTKIHNIIETPLFVDSKLTSMVQVADLCSYSIRRYLENGEEDLFNLIFRRTHMRYGLTVGMRHYSDKDCTCKICSSHTK